MTKISLALLLLLVASCSSQVKQVERAISSNPTNPTILLVGDSNMVGSFGDELHGSIQKWNEADVLSIAIGGGNAAYYLNTMTNKCCGFKVRFSEKGAAIKILGKSGTKNMAQVLPEYGGSLLNVLKKKKPTMVVIALGSNADSLKNYTALLKKIHDFDDTIPVYWVGPPDDKAINAMKADTNIQKAVNEFPTSPYTFFSSQKVVKKLHPGPADAKKWVNGFIAELKNINRK
jgi:hypothetical protein